MPMCFVEGCGNYYEKTRGTKNIIYHMMPGNQILAQKWTRACGRQDKTLPYYARICSDHFSEECYQRDLQHELLGLPLRKKLKAAAIPDTNLPKQSKDKLQNVKDQVTEILKNKRTLLPKLAEESVITKNVQGSNKNVAALQVSPKRKTDINLKLSTEKEIKNLKSKRNATLPKLEIMTRNSVIAKNKPISIMQLSKTQKMLKAEILKENEEKGRLSKIENNTITSSKNSKDKFTKVNNLNIKGPDILKENGEKESVSKINNKFSKQPIRSSYRIAKKKSIETLSDSFTEKVNSKCQMSHRSEKFTDKLKYMAKLQLLFEKNEKKTPENAIADSSDKVKREEKDSVSEGNYERDVQHELLGLPTRCRLKRGAIPDQNLPNDFLKEEKQVESAIAVLLAVGLMPASKSESTNGGLPQDLNKMQIMEDVREGCDANPPSSPGHAEQRSGDIGQVIKQEDITENGTDETEKPEEMQSNDHSVKEEIEDKKSEEDIEDKHEENSSNHSSTSETNNKRKQESRHSPIKRLKTEIDDNFYARDKIMNDFAEITECNSLDQIQKCSNKILNEIKTLNELAKEKEREWNNLLHLKKLKEELLIRLQRKRQVLLINESDLSEFQPETNGQQSLLKCSQKVNMLRELRAANMEKLKQQTSLLQSAYRQKPMLDVRSIIADYRQRHPETVPRRGRRIRNVQSESKTSILGFSGGILTIGQKSETDNTERGLLSNINGSQDDSHSSNQHPWYRPADDIKSYKDVLLQFSKLSQSEQADIQMQLQSSKPPPPYPEVTVHPVTSTSSVAPTNSLLHGILTKTPVRQTHSNGNNPAINGGKSSFSPTLARLLTAPERSGGIHLTSTPNMIAGSILNPANVSISNIFSGNKVRNEITITPVGSQYESTKRESTEEESEDHTDRLVIDEALDSLNSRNKEDNRSEDGEDVLQCQGCNQKSAQFVCAGCGNQWYCSRECQVASWDDHSDGCSG